MKKIGIVVLGVSLLVAAGCQKNEEPKIPVQKQEVKSNEPVLYKGIKVSTSTTVKERALHLLIQVENTSKKVIPLTLENHELFYVKIKDANGRTVYNEKIKEEKRKNIEKKEKVSWEKEIALDGNSTSYTVEVALLVEDTAKATFNEEELTSVEEVKGHVVDMPYIPEEKTTYVYEDMINQVEVEEEYLYFKEGIAQSRNATQGTSIYQSDDTGYYSIYRSSDATEGNLLESLTPDKKLLLPLPVTVGAEWIVDDVTHKVVSTSETVQTPYKIFENVVKVETGDGKVLYYHPEIGLIQVEQDGKVLLTLTQIR